MEFPFPCPPEENILRAIREADWDSKYARFSSSLFRGPNTSIARLEITPFHSLMKIFSTKLDKPRNSVIGAGKLNVGSLQKAGLGYKAKPTNIIVTADGEDFEAHGVINPKLSSGLAKKIADEHMELHYARRFVTIRYIVKKFLTKSLLKNKSNA